jgi:hypothetical protein
MLFNSLYKAIRLLIMIKRKILSNKNLFKKI